MAVSSSRLFGGCGLVFPLSSGRGGGAAMASRSAEMSDMMPDAFPWRESSPSRSSMRSWREPTKASVEVSPTSGGAASMASKAKGETPAATQRSAGP